MTGKAVRRLMAFAVCAFYLAGCGPKPSGPSTEEDPITRVSVPGAYGVGGGDQVLQPARQTSVLYFDNRFTFRIIEPATQTVASLSGLPVNLKAGDTVSMHYRLQKGGKTVVSESYENAKILMTNDKMAWIKKSDGVYFVVQLF